MLWSKSISVARSPAISANRTPESRKQAQDGLVAAILEVGAGAGSQQCWYPDLEYLPEGGVHWVRIPSHGRVHGHLPL